MSILAHRTRRLQPTRHTTKPAAPFAEGVFPDPLGPSDEERRLLDELNGDFPTDSIEAEPADWPAWTDRYPFSPSEEDAAWAEQVLNQGSPHFDVVSPGRRPGRDTVAASMIDANLARALANGTLPIE
jgi:hypothetical protein